MDAGGTSDSEKQARQWLAEFSTLLELDEGASEDELRRAVELAQRLAVLGPDLRSSLPYDAVDPAVGHTMEQALRQVPGVAEELRRRLARSQGAPVAADLDLEELQDRLSEREARSELGVTSEEENPRIVELPRTDPNYVGSAFMGLFGLGWTSFVTVHCVLMIGGLSKAIGFGALALLLFYAIFFAVGFGMLYTAWAGLWSEEVSLEGRQMTVARKLGSWVRVARHELDADVPVKVTLFTGGVRAKNDDAAPQYSLEVTESSGKKRKLCTGTEKELLQRNANRLNACLRAYRDLA